MWFLLTAPALAAQVTLHVGVPQHLGTAERVVAEGSTGPCAAEAARIVCQSDSPVRFRWPDPEHVLVGDEAVEPGNVGRAWVLAAPETRRQERARLAAILDDEIDGNDLLELRELLVYTSEFTPPWPSAGLLEDQRALIAHPDKRVRREAAEAWHPWMSGTPFDPLPVDAPVPLDEYDLTRLANDPDPGVRRRLARMLRDARPDLDRVLARRLLDALLADPHPGVRRAAVAGLPDSAYRGILTPTEAWQLALARVPQPRPVGRASCNQLAKLRSQLDAAGPEVDVDAALALVLRHHPERAWRFWTTWHDRIEPNPGGIRRLLLHTTGLDPVLVRHWAETDRATLDGILRTWTPQVRAHRRELVLRILSDLDSAP